MKLLIDTNVILDIIFNRKGCEAAINLFKRAEQKLRNWFNGGGSEKWITELSNEELFSLLRLE